MTDMTMNLPVLKTHNLSAYIKSVYAVPLLSAEEERALAERYREYEDIEAAQRLVLSNLRYVVQIANRFMGYGLPLGDLIQEGNIGLMKAVKRFDPKRNIRLVSFAVHWIRADIYDFILKNWKIVRVATTKAQRKLFFNLRNRRQSLEPMTESEIKQLASDLDVPEKDVRLMEVRMTKSEVSFNPGNNEDEDGSYVSAPEQYIEDNSYNPELNYERNQTEIERNNLLTKALNELDDRSRDIIVQRWLTEDTKKTPLRELANKYELSAERIRQIERNAMLKLRNSLGEYELSA